MGRAVVGYNHGGVGEILEKVFPEGRVAVGDIAMAAQRVAEFITTPPQVLLVQPYTLAKMLECTLALYQDLAGGAGYQGGRSI